MNANDIAWQDLPHGDRSLLEAIQMADVRRLDLELLASEGLEVEGLKAKEDDEKAPPEEV